MKSERINSIIFTISSVVFLLHVVGYFAPAWFVQEVAVKPDAKGIRADGRRFELPYLPNFQDLLKNPDQAQSNDERESDNDIHKEMPKDGSGQDLDPAMKKDKVKRSINKDNDTKEESGKAVSSHLAIERPDKNKVIPGKDMTMLIRPENNKIEKTTQDNTSKDKNEPWVKGKDEKNVQTNTKPQSEPRDQILYLTAGLWYSRACITTRDSSSAGDDDGDGMQWCTLYTRFDDSTLEKRKNMFELRLEATIGVVLSALSLVFSGITCCSRRHRGCGTISALVALFVSGAVTAIPVVHMILQHLQIHEKIVRARNWMLLTKIMYRHHDLFDHYSVILCGVASLISVLSAFIITIISCKSSTSKPDNWYDLKHVQEEKESKNELPIHWIHNNKITVPEVSEIKEETKDDSESGYSEVKEEGTASIHDGGSTGNDCERLKLDSSEMKTFDM